LTNFGKGGLLAFVRWMQSFIMLPALVADAKHSPAPAFFKYGYGIKKKPAGVRGALAGRTSKSWVALYQVGSYVDPSLKQSLSSILKGSLRRSEHHKERRLPR
jgi:hypothetical protein